MKDPQKGNKITLWSYEDSQPLRADNKNVSLVFKCLIHSLNNEPNEIKKQNYLL